MRLLRTIALATVGAIVAGASIVGAASADFCFGWNVDECGHAAREVIPLMKMGSVDVSCVDCYFQAKGTLEFDIQPLEKKLRIGAEDMEIDFVGEVDVKGSDQWAFDRSASPTVFRATLIDEHVGTIPVHVWIEIPLLVDIRGAVSGDADGTIRVALNGSLGSWETVYDHGWAHIYPSPRFELTHQLSGKLDLEGSITLVVNPDINVHVDDIFEGGITIDQTAEIDISAQEPHAPYAFGTIHENQDIECSLCLWLSTEAETLLASNFTLERAENVLDDMCNGLGDALSPLCKQAVASYLPAIVSYIESKIPPQLICQKLSLCSSRVYPTLARQVVRIKPVDENQSEDTLFGPVRYTGDGHGCIACTFIANEAEKLLASNFSLEVMEGILETACANLGPIADVCTGFVTQYLPRIVTYLEEKISPETLCAKLGLCAAIPQLGGLESGMCAELKETFDVDWKGELQLDWFHIDKTFDRNLIHFDQNIHSKGCPVSATA